jgi:hypothetical protein
VDTATSCGGASAANEWGGWYELWGTWDVVQADTCTGTDVIYRFHFIKAPVTAWNVLVAMTTVVDIKAQCPGTQSQELRIAFSCVVAILFRRALSL